MEAHEADGMLEVSFTLEQEQENGWREDQWNECRRLALELARNRGALGGQTVRREEARFVWRFQCK